MPSAIEVESPVLESIDPHAHVKESKIIDEIMDSEASQQLTLIDNVNIEDATPVTIKETLLIFYEWLWDVLEPFGHIARTGAMTAIAYLAFHMRIYSVKTFESLIHEFDPWFNYRATEWTVQHGPLALFTWFDPISWYPEGRHVGKSLFPGLMLWTWFCNTIINGMLQMNVALRDICVFMGPVCSLITCLVTYGLTLEASGGDRTAGLISAFLIAICPGNISRTVAGSFDYECIAITLMLTSMWAWVSGVKRGSRTLALVSGILYGFLGATWGGYVYLGNLIPLHAIAMLILEWIKQKISTGHKPHYTPKIQTVFPFFYCAAVPILMAVPKTRWAPVKSVEHWAALGLFIWSVVWPMATKVLGPKGLQALIAFSAPVVAWIIKQVGLHGRLYRIFLAPKAPKSALFQSIAEQAASTWGYFYSELHAISLLAIPGFYIMAHESMSLSTSNATNAPMFMVLFALTSSLFTASMVRVMLVFAPVACILAGVTVSRATVRCKDPWFRLLTMSIMARILVKLFRHCHYVAAQNYSNPSYVYLMRNQADPRAPAAKVDDFREAYQWLAMNTPPETRVLAWWDYGYQLAGMANRVTYVDNNTRDDARIASIARILVSDEHRAWELVRGPKPALSNVDLVMVVWGGLVGIQSDDINKAYWITRIASEHYPEEIKHEEYFDSKTNTGASAKARNSLIYRTALNQVHLLVGDRIPVPKEELSRPLDCWEEVYSTTFFMVRFWRPRKACLKGQV